MTMIDLPKTLIVVPAPVTTFIHRTTPSESLFNPVRNAGWVKPDGGMWTSPHDCEFGWRQWCEAEDWGDIESPEYVLTPRQDARVVVIDRYYDLIDLLVAYPGKGHMDHIVADEDDRAHVLDYEAMARDFDGIWLTENGQWRTRLTKRKLYGWDCETVLFFHWVFTDVHLKEAP